MINEVILVGLVVDPVRGGKTKSGTLFAETRIESSEQLPDGTMWRTFTPVCAYAGQATNFLALKPGAIALAKGKISHRRTAEGRTEFFVFVRYVTEVALPSGGDAPVVYSSAGDGHPAGMAEL